MPIAHKGIHNGKVPENSLTAFQKAVEGNFPIELDVHIIKSGEVVVFHDDNLKRMCGIDKEISKCTFTELRELYLKNSHERIPLLSEALAKIDGKVPLLIELKYDQPTGRLEAATLEILKYYKGKYALQSFNPLSLRWLKKHAPNIPRGQLASDFKGNKKVSILLKPLLKNIWHFSTTKPDFISYDIHALPSKRIAKLRAAGTPVLGWTVSDITESKEALKYCDNLICEKIL
jgi:glycerophosphoryl diester phosphodiesterase